MNNHPIQPSPELIARCMKMVDCRIVDVKALAEMVAQWGADQELEACDGYVSDYTDWPTGYLTSMRRPKPPRLKAQALEALTMLEPLPILHVDGIDLSTIRRALEALPNDN